MPRWGALPKEIQERFPAPPKRSSFASNEDYEEGLRYWQSHVGPNVSFAMLKWRETPRKLWYRRVPHNAGLVFAEPERAAYVARLHHALKHSRTWGEFRAAVPDAEYQEVVGVGFTDSGEEAPADTDAFDAEMVPGWSDGEYPPWLQQEMEHVLPQDVVEAFGRATATTVNGYYLDIPWDQEAAICKLLREKGFEVERREEMFW